MKRIWSVAWTVLAVAASAPGESLAQLNGVDLRITEIADSGAYFLYAYELTNSPESAWGLLEITLDIGASSATLRNVEAMPRDPESTGSFFDLTRGGGSAPRTYAQVGPITPSGWNAILSRVASLTWSPNYSPEQSDDSIAPGQTKEGFGIRSAYLPGIRDLQAVPTVESCCLLPNDSTDGEFLYPSPGDFVVIERSIGPQYVPAEVTIALLRDQLDAVCTTTGWLKDASLCSDFAELLEMAAADDAEANFLGAATALERLETRIDEEGAGMHANAYWLLKINTAEVLDKAMAGAH